MKVAIISVVFMMFSSFNVVYAFSNVILQIVLDTTAGSCQGKDWDYVQNQIYTMASKQRQLRGDIENDKGNTTDSLDSFTNDEEVDNMDHRALPYSRACANKCVGYTTGRCMALNCKGYRRSRSLIESIIATRELFWSTSCENQKSEIRNLLTNMANSNMVGTSCKASLRQPAQMTCFSNTQC